MYNTSTRVQYSTFLDCGCENRPQQQQQQPVSQPASSSSRTVAPWKDSLAYLVGGGRFSCRRHCKVHFFSIAGFCFWEVFFENGKPQFGVRRLKVELFHGSRIVREVSIGSESCGTTEAKVDPFFCVWWWTRLAENRNFSFLYGYLLCGRCLNLENCGL